MRNLSICLGFVSLMLSSCATRGPFIYPDVEQIDFETVEWQHPRPRRAELPNGMVLYLLEDRSLPLIDAYAFMRAGSLYDPEEMAGLSEVTCRTMRTGGTRSRSPESIDSLIEYNAARVEFSSGLDAMTCSFSSLKDNFRDVLSIFADLLVNPSFREDRLQVEVARLQERIRRRDDSPLDLASVNFRQILRRNHPTGRFPTLSSVEKIRREDLISFHNTYCHPGNFVMALAGDFDADSILQAVAAAFAHWETKEIDFPPFPSLENCAGPRIHHIDRKTSQSTIIMGHLSIHRTDPDLFPLLMANRILGASGLTSRLFQEVREERGMAYYVASRLSPGNMGKGEFYLICQTEGSKTVGAIELMLLEVERIRKGVEKSELEDARESMKNEFVFTFESPLQIARNQAFLEFYDLPVDYYDNYIDNVEGITMETLREAAARWFHPDEMQILVVGDSSQFDKPLEEFGEVESIEFGE